jgi:hypothetical protein
MSSDDSMAGAAGEDVRVAVSQHGASGEVRRVILRQQGGSGTWMLKGKTVMAGAEGGRWCSVMAMGSRRCALSPDDRRRERGKRRWSGPASQEGG